MVLRMWKTRSTAKQAVAYIELATKEVFPKVRAIEGHRGEYLLRREMRTVSSWLCLRFGTRWRRFAGSRDRSRTRRSWNPKREPS